MAHEMMVDLPEGKVNPLSLDASTATIDAVSSLRALALSTMRLKRRRDASQQQDVGPSRLSPALQRPSVATTEIDMLDYGSEEQSNNQQENDGSDALVATGRLPTDNSFQADSSKGDVREEGEISDEEEAGPASALSRSNDVDEDTSLHATPLTSSLSRAPLSPSPHSRDRSDPVSRDQVPWNNWVPQPDHVRPGLKMSMAQFNQVKELVLDLLGWGVSPEYLVDCGLTRESVFYSFTELNLRLPNNLDTSGLVPLPLPESLITSSQAAGPASNSSSQPTPPQTQTPPSPRLSLSHPLPLKPSSLEKELATTSEAPPVTSNGTSLNDMEAQRRLELQARKAVLASRKKKVQQALSETHHVHGVSSRSIDDPRQVNHIQQESIPVAPTDAVDNFLKSMLETSAVPSSSSSSVLPQSSRSQSSGEALDIVPEGDPVASVHSVEVDTGGIPGLGSYLPAASLKPQTCSPSPEIPFTSSTASTLDIGNDISQRKDDSPAPSALLDARLKSGTAAGPASAHELPPSLSGKRGTKRPVAMDFVEDDRDASGSSRRTSPPLPSRPPVRRKAVGFAGLGSLAHRRCVINLSDSEDDSDRTVHPMRASPPIVPLFRPEAPHAGLSRPSSRNLIYRPQIVQPSTKPSTPIQTPESLLEKEEQIKKMRELIAQSELKRLRKLAEKSRTSIAPPPVPRSAMMRASKSPTPFDAPLMIEHEDAESSSNAMLAAVNNGIASISSRSQSDSDSACDRAEEDAVMQDLMSTGAANNSISSTPNGISLNLPDVNVEESAMSAETQADAILEGDDAQSDMELSPTDAIPSTSSAEVTESSVQETTLFSAYSSPFRSYPLLRSRARVVADLTSESALHSRNTTSSNQEGKVTIPDLRPLRVAVILRETNDTGRRICQYEIPGGGLCRDKTCTDVHLADLDTISSCLTDQETARYLLESMPALRKFDESEIMDQLLQARQKKSISKFTNSSMSEMPTSSNGNSLETIVVEAVAMLTGAG